MMRKILLIILIVLSTFVSCVPEEMGGVNGDEQDVSELSGDESEKNYEIILNYIGPAYDDTKVVYAAWIENEIEKNIQNIYICNRVVEIGKKLLGDALPYWKTVKYPENDEIDGLTGASIQEEFSIDRKINLDNEEKIRICFEIDRSKNSNYYFADRPSFIYKTDLIDVNNLDESYNLNLDGWMVNDTDDSEYPQYNQQPLYDIPEFEQYKYMEDLIYIADDPNIEIPTYSDTVTSLKVHINKK